MEALETRQLLTIFTPSDTTQLIAHINTANSNGEVDTIDLQGQTFTLSAADNTGTAGNDNGLPVILADNGNGLTIENGTLQRDTADGTPAFRILEIGVGADVTIDRVSITGGLAADSGNGFGGGILNHGTLRVNQSTIFDNVAATGGISFGGGILNSASGWLTLTNSTISHNQATRDNVSGSGTGGGIHSVGTLVVTNSTISGNMATSGGGINNVGSATLKQLDHHQ